MGRNFAYVDQPGEASRSGADIVRIAIILILLCSIFGSHSSKAQSPLEKDHYIGLLPSFLAEPYDTISALEVNIAPFVYERRLENISVQIRPMVNYRFYKVQSGISQVGGTFLVKKYLKGWVNEESWLIPSFSGFTTYTYNNLDLIHTITLGIEGGATAILSEHWSMSLTLQPGINYYPTPFSREFAGADSGFLSHFGIMFHIGYSFGE